MTSTKLGYLLNNVKPITDKQTAVMLVDLLEDSIDFLTYYSKLIVDLNDYFEANSKDGDNTWNKSVPVPIIEGLAKFLKEYQKSLRQSLRDNTRNKYVIIKNDLCSLEIIAHRVDRLVMRTNNTIGLYLADYYFDRDAKQVIGTFNAIVEDMEQDTEGMVSMLNLSKDIIRIHNKANDY